MTLKFRTGWLPYRARTMRRVRVRTIRALLLVRLRSLSYHSTCYICSDRVGFDCMALHVAWRCSVSRSLTKIDDCCRAVLQWPLELSVCQPDRPDLRRAANAITMTKQATTASRGRAVSSTPVKSGHSTSAALETPDTRGTAVSSLVTRNMQNLNSDRESGWAHDGCWRVCDIWHDFFRPLQKNSVSAECIR